MLTANHHHQDVRKFCTYQKGYHHCSQRSIIPKSFTISRNRCHQKVRELRTLLAQITTYACMHLTFADLTNHRNHIVSHITKPCLRIARENRERYAPLQRATPIVLRLYQNTSPYLQIDATKRYQKSAGLIAEITYLLLASQRSHLTKPQPHCFRILINYTEE